MSNEAKYGALSDRIINILEDNDIELLGVYAQDDEYVTELEMYSDEGEDVVFTFFFDGSDESFVREFRSYAEDFDPDEHASEWVESRGIGGCPSSIRALVEDAEGIKETLYAVADALEGPQGETDYDSSMIDEVKSGLRALVARIENGHEHSYDLQRILNGAICEVDALEVV